MDRIVTIKVTCTLSGKARIKKNQTLPRPTNRIPLSTPAIRDGAMTMEESITTVDRNMSLASSFHMGGLQSMVIRLLRTH